VGAFLQVITSSFLVLLVGSELDKVELNRLVSRASTRLETSRKFEGKYP